MTDTDWLTKCLEELKLPGNPWYQVSELVSEALAYRIRIEGLTFGQFSVVSKYVSDDFVKKHNLSRSTPSGRNASTHVTDAEIQKFLKDVTLKAAHDVNCSMPQNSSTDPSFIEMIELIKQYFKNAIENKNLSSTSLDSNVRFDNKIEALGSTVVEILRNDPGKLDEVISPMKGRFMPQCLRKYIYRLILLKIKKEKACKEITVKSDAELTQQKIRELFVSKVKSGLREMKLDKPTETSVSHLVRSSVVEVFETHRGLVDYSTDIPMHRQLCRVLNIFYTHSRKFEHLYALWLFPLLFTYTKDHHHVKEHDFELAMWLDIVISELIPPWNIINRISLSSLLDISSTKQIVDLKSLFISVGISIDEGSIKKMLLSSFHPRESFSSPSSSTSSGAFSPTGKKHIITFTHPIFFLRQWLSQLFVGNPNLKVTMFIWDQLFLHRWSERCLKHACMAFVLCLSDGLSKCQSKDDLMNSLRNDVVDVTIKDIAKAWKDVNELWPL